MASHNLSKIVLGDIEIIGYSMAGEETVVALPQFDVCFDIGKAPDQVISISHCLLSHCHMDHAAGFAYYLSHRNFCGMERGTLMLPSEGLNPVRRILEAWGKLDGNSIPARLIAVHPNDEYQIKPNIFVRVFKVRHSKGAIGYSILEKRKKLKAEYKGLGGPELVELKRKGVRIENDVEIPLVSYMGDTEYVDLRKLDFVANSKILITECTFYIDEHVERARAGKHMHIKDLGKMVSELNNEYVVLTHTTQRTSIGEAKRIMAENVPEDLQKKILFLMDRKYRQG